MALVGFREVTILEESQLEELIVEVRVGKLKNRKETSKDEIAG